MGRRVHAVVRCGVKLTDGIASGNLLSRKPEASSSRTELTPRLKVSL
jgi:hypothetical protein